MANTPAKKILQQAAPHVGATVIVIAPGVEGSGYYASSIPVGHSKHLEFQITLVNEALKRLKQWHRRRLQEESNMAKKTVTAVKLGKNMKSVKEISVPTKGGFGNPKKPAKCAMKGGKK